MLFNPCRDEVPVLYSGSRIFNIDLGVVGIQLCDLDEADRVWTIQRGYVPLKHRRQAGLRFKVMDQKGFISFIAQQDLELLLQLAQPGEHCPWMGRRYPAIDSSEFYGFCADTDDLHDDLLDRELDARQYCFENNLLVHNQLPVGLELTRRVHLDHGRDYEELYTLLQDNDPVTKQGPACDVQNIEYRWARVERGQRIVWAHM